jgi:hypothetical protein
MASILLDREVCANVRRSGQSGSEPDGHFFAGIAQLVEQLICNQQVVGSNPTAGSSTATQLSDCD